MRLRDIGGNRLLLPDAMRPDDMDSQFVVRCNVAAMNLAQIAIQNDSFRVPSRKSWTCRMAMTEFETVENRDHHGNAFKEFFADLPIAKMNKIRIQDFISWLLEKYHRNEQTVSKKVFAASALFRWMKKNNHWLGENPFSEALKEVKFAAPAQKKSIIETEELSRLLAVVADPHFRDVRILIEILYCTGLRVTEALAVTREDIDIDRRVLQYLRTKTHRKAPDWRRIPIPSHLVAVVVNEGISSGPIFPMNRRHYTDQMKKATEAAQVGIQFKTFRADFATRARAAGASVDDVNLIQGRRETILEKNYTVDPWFIAHQCRWWIDKMFDEKQGLQIVK